jgi:hypothetical protein
MPQITYFDEGYIVLGGIEFLYLPEVISVDQYELYKKNEFHVTLVGAKASNSLPDAEDSKAIVRAAFDEFASTHDLTRFELTNEFRLLKREDRVTVVAMVNLHGMDQLYAFLNDKLGTALPVQPAHITIYSFNPAVGISLNSAEQVENESTIVEIPELQEALRT